MSRRTVLKSIAMFAATALVAGSTFADELGRGTSIDDWKGLGVLKGGKGYVATPMGQLHYRDVGPRDDTAPIVLLHQSPMSMIQWGEVQNALAALGVRSIAVDTPGYGLSDPPAKQPYIWDLADNLVPLLDHLKLAKAVMAGHHTGAQIATSFTARHPDRVAALVLHGSAMFSDEESAGRRARIGKGIGTGRLAMADGKHLSDRFAAATPKRQELLDADTWVTLTSFMSGPDIGHWAAYHYDMEDDVAKVKVPTLLLTDTADPINVMDKRLAAMRPDFKYVEFSTGGTMEFMADPKRWAALVADWRAKSLATKVGSR